MPVFDQWFGKAREEIALARRAELEGDLARATQLWVDAGEPGEAARVLVIRGDAELDSARRLQHYVQAVGLAPAGQAVQTIARRKRALLAIELARAGAHSAGARRDLVDAARDLEALGDAPDAARAYALAGDLEGQSRCLIEAGEGDALEDVLERDHARERMERAARQSRTQVERLLASGDRRAALERARDHSDDDRVRAILAARASSPRVTLELHGDRLILVLGDEVVVGRSEGAITVSSQAVSRRHLAIARVGGGAELRDLASRNGTMLRGMRLAGPIAVPSSGIEVTLGGEVPLTVLPSAAIEGAFTIELGGARYVAPLGAATLGTGAWSLEAARDGWIELVTADSPVAYLGATRLDARVPLLIGDAISEVRGGEAILRVLG